ncbi:primosomal protein N' [Cytobacillus firmus]|uniref:primosomal protein N' n=1 Tax=Cytobacillus firmus TaxID=1399 RepID=UPI00077C84BF|nr:primosomal protein N' [Cytobacillus firmus]MBG9544165.1 primosomal protein N' [Cytobacillus firmus]MBG9550735.1 primosomal protein N' [Cytobacillus firmus]MBG9556534.1 primosomal protein N' [Cytobacillus firmus]MBG9574510.1 primosomal protein N' [Cytobacillus firmus]MEC1892711.1 primosomal protein N' [Cytobacillus firmus]
MNIASVIVDVPAKQTDRAFDYKIPSHLNGVIFPGMRVVVPFGPRKIQGFVTGLKAESDLQQLKSILEPMDLYPVLNRELLTLGEWLTEKTLCYKISAFQAMLPAALKAKYEKKLVMAENADRKLLPEKVSTLFQNAEEITWDDAVKGGALPLLQKETSNGNIEIIHQVKERVKKKKVKQVFAAAAAKELTDYLQKLPGNATKQKEVLEYFLQDEGPVDQKELFSLLGITSSTLKGLLQKGLLGQKDVEIYRNPFGDREFQRTEPLSLTDGQRKAIIPILDSIEDNRHETFLLYGVTGSGKTEVYLQSIQRVLKDGKEAIVLVPEISLTPQMVKRFKGRFGDQVAVMHSGLSAGEKYDEWRKIQRKEVKVVVGARSAIFAPFENLGIIIIDEEHETSYKQEENPRYHARDVAIKRAENYKCPVVLGSATPSLESFARAQKGVYHLLTLENRMNNQALPAVDIIDMREELREGNRSMFSRKLLAKIKDRLGKKEQIVLFLNKRGHSSFVMCRDCGYVINCPHCDISLTYHRYNQQMKCHYCGYEALVPNACPECESEHIRYFGTGTQKVEEELAKILPEAKVIRMDVDTTSRKGAHEKLLDQFQEGHADILLGTQMIAKGLDFPNITLVGVLSADTMLHLPDFRSSEKTFQLLTQVSGRAGRHELEGEVIIQTYTPEHYSIELAGEQDYDKFYDREMMARKIHRYPPFFYISLVTVSHEELMKAVSVTEKITQYIQSKLSAESIVLGPVASPIPRINNRYRYQCLIKYKREPELGQTLKKILDNYQQEISAGGLTVSIDLNPYILM